MSTRVLIVEDELLIAHYIREVLEAEGIAVTGIARSHAEAKDLCRESPPDLVLMDISLKGPINGVESAQILRQEYDFALVYLTAHGEAEVLEQARPTRPVGYLVKPVNDRTLVATIRMACDRGEEAPRPAAPEPPVERVRLNGELSYDTANFRLITATGGMIELTPHESRFIELLLRNRGRTVTTSRALEYLWDVGTASDGALKTLVWRLRRKVSDKTLIQTVTGLGYKLV